MHDLPFFCFKLLFYRSQMSSGVCGITLLMQVSVLCALTGADLSGLYIWFQHVSVLIDLRWVFDNSPSCTSVFAQLLFMDDWIIIHTD